MSNFCVVYIKVNMRHTDIISVTVFKGRKTDLCFFPVGSRFGHLHPDKEGHGLQGKPGADHRGRSQPTGSGYPAILDDPRRTDCLPM